MNTNNNFKGLYAATFTPFNNDGLLNLKVVPSYYKRLKNDGVAGAFVCGTTGEGLLMSVTERKKITEAWTSVIDGDFQLMVSRLMICSNNF